MAALVLFDTNILIDATKGYPEALAELAHWDDPAISSITWMEVYAGADVVQAGPGSRKIFGDKDKAIGVFSAGA